MMRSGWLPRGSLGGSFSEPSRSASSSTAGQLAAEHTHELFEGGRAERQLGRGFEDAVECGIVRVGVALGAKRQRVESDRLVGRPDDEVGAVSHDLDGQGEQGPSHRAVRHPAHHVGEPEEDLALVGVQVGRAVHLVDRLVEVVVGPDRELAVAPHQRQVVERAAQPDELVLTPGRPAPLGEGGGRGALTAQQVGVGLAQGGPEIGVEHPAHVVAPSIVKVYDQLVLAALARHTAALGRGNFHCENQCGL